VRRSSSLGTDPVSKLPHKVRLCKSERLPSSVGTVPESILACNSNVSKKGLSPKLVGSVPDRRFEERSIVAGKNNDSKKARGPVRLLLFREITSKRGRQ
jgi:hypothetical protein